MRKVLPNTRRAACVVNQVRLCAYKLGVSKRTASNWPPHVRAARFAVRKLLSIRFNIAAWGTP
jgi:hypothetical protein